MTESGLASTERDAEQQVNGLSLIMVSLAVSIAAYAARLAFAGQAGQFDTGLSFVSLAVFATTLIAAATVIALLWRSVSASRTNHQNLAISAALSAILVGLTTNAPVLGAMRGNSVIGIAVCIVSAITIHLATKNKMPVTSGPSIRRVRRRIDRGRFDLDDLRTPAAVASEAMIPVEDLHTREAYPDSSTTRRIPSDSPVAAPMPLPIASEPFVLAQTSPAPRLKSRTSRVTEPNLSHPFVGHSLFTFPESQQSRVRWCAKGDGAQEDSQDAAAISLDETRFALCDGVSGSELPRPWASLIARHWTENPFFPPIEAADLARWLEAPRQEWHDWVLEEWIAVLNDRNQRVGRALISQAPAIRAVDAGASTTALGLMLTGRHMDVEWHAMAIGDSNLFQFSWGQSGWFRERSFPMLTGTSFDDVPDQIDTMSPVSPALLPDLVQHTKGTCNNGDVLLMATDKLAAWILSHPESTSTAWDRLFLAVSSQPGFSRFVKAEREAGRLIDDDTTVIFVPIRANPARFHANAEKPRQ